MSTLSDALAALKNVVLMEERLDSMRSEQKRTAQDVSGLVDMVAAIRDRVARLEGIIEGVAMAARSRPELPEE